MTLDATVDEVLAVRAGRDSAARARSRTGIRALQLTMVGAATLSIPHVFEHFEKLGTTLEVPVSAEWTSIAAHLTHRHPWMYAFFLLLGLWLASLAIDRRARRSALTLLLAALAAAAFMYSRFVVQFAIIASVVTYRSCLTAALRVEGRLRARPVLVQALMGFALLLAIEFETRQTYGEMAFGMDELGNPVSQARFMQKQGMHGRVFAPGRAANAYLYMRLWPEVLIFADGRVPQVFPVSFSQLHARSLEPEVFAGLVARYDIDHVVIDKSSFSRAGRAWADRLEEHGGFALVYFDERGMVWTRKRAGGLSCRTCRAFRRLKPWRTDREWIEQEFSKQPFDEVWDELSYMLQVTDDKAVARALITELIEYGGAQPPQRERLRLLLDGTR